VPKKQQKPAIKTAEVDALSNETVLEKKTTKTKAKTAKKPAENIPPKPADIPAVHPEPDVEDMVQPERSRMLINAVALAVVIVVLVFVAIAMRQPQQSHDVVKSGGDSSKADALLNGGNKVCTNGSSQTDTTGSSNPQSVGMMLQNNPANTIQTPETVSAGSDASTLQGAACF